MSTGNVDKPNTGNFETVIFLNAEDAVVGNDAEIIEYEITGLTLPSQTQIQQTPLEIPENSQPVDIDGVSLDDVAQDIVNAGGLEEHTIHMATQVVADLRFEEEGKSCRPTTNDLPEHSHSDIVNNFDGTGCNEPVGNCNEASSQINQINTHDSSNAVTLEEHLSSELSLQPTPVQSDEPSLETLNAVNPESPSEIVHKIIKQGSERGRDKLYDNQGFSYTARRTTKCGTTWICSVRNKANVCPGKVKQTGDNFTRLLEHNHKPLPNIRGSKIASTISKRLREEARAKPFVPALELAKRIVREEFPDTVPCSALPNLYSLERKANRFRRASRPSEPKDIDFNLQLEHIPQEFLRFDIKVSSYRHIGFATKQQIKLLRKAKIWYIDQTVHLVRKPFVQLLTINFVVKSGKDIKQVPGFFVLMSRQETSDHMEVFKKVKKKCGRRMRVTKIVLDFDEGPWIGLEEVFPSIKKSGCAVHYQKAIYQHVQKLGLAKAYSMDNETSQIINKLMSLCLLPHRFIHPLFRQMVEAHQDDERILPLFDYVRKTWIQHPLWKTENVSVYGSPICTKNDCETWISRIKEKGPKGTSLYLLIELLKNDTLEELSAETHLVSERKFKRYQEKRYKVNHKRIFALWRKYEDGRKSGRKLLCALSKIQLGGETHLRKL